MWFGWLLVIIILAMIEVAVKGLVTVWFVASAILSLGVSFLTDEFIIQFAVFVIGGFIFLLLTKPLIQKRSNKDVNTNLDRVVGMKGKVTEKIWKDSIGEVYVDGKRWSAISEEEIDVNEPVIILAIDGVKLKVRKER